MDVWLTSLLPIATLILGSGLTFATEERRWRRQINREDQLRFVMDKRDTYASFIAACNRAIGHLRDAERIQHELKTLTQMPGITRKQLDRIEEDLRFQSGKARECFSTLEEVHSSLQLLAPASVLAQASNLVTARNQSIEDFYAAVGEFADAAREDMGVGKLSDNDL